MLESMSATEPAPFEFSTVPYKQTYRMEPRWLSMGMQKTVQYMELVMGRVGGVENKVEKVRMEMPFQKIDRFWKEEEII